MVDMHIPDPATVRARIEAQRAEMFTEFMTRCIDALKKMTTPSVVIWVPDYIGDDVVADAMEKLRSRGWVVERWRGSLQDPVDELHIALPEVG